MARSKATKQPSGAISGLLRYARNDEILEGAGHFQQFRHGVPVALGSGGFDEFAQFGQHGRIRQFVGRVDVKGLVGEVEAFDRVAGGLHGGLIDIGRRGQ